MALHSASARSRLRMPPVQERLDAAGLRAMAKNARTAPRDARAGRVAAPTRAADSLAERTLCARRATAAQGVHTSGHAVRSPPMRVRRSAVRKPPRPSHGSCDEYAVHARHLASLDRTPMRGATQTASECGGAGAPLRAFAGQKSQGNSALRPRRASAAGVSRTQRASQR
jgi:hypothetical protein